MKFRMYLIAFTFILTIFCLTGCNNTLRTEYNQENNANIANVISELKARYHLSDNAKNEIIVRGEQSGKDSYVEGGSVTFNLYIDSDKWEDGQDAALYTLKRVSAMCSSDTISTLSCFVWLNEGGYYVTHFTSYAYSKNSPDDFYISFTEFDLEDLEQAYNAIKDDYGLEPHHTSENDSIKYITPAFQLKPSIRARWFADANLKVTSNCSTDELIKIGEYAHLFLGSALTIHASETGDYFFDEISYDITVFGEGFYITGENKDGSETMVWERTELY